MSKSTLTSVLLLCMLTTTAQFVYQKQVYLYPGVMPATEKPYEKIFMKGVGKNLYLYVQEKRQQDLWFKVLNLDLEKGRIVDSFMLPPFPKGYLIRDIIPGETAAETIFLRNGELILFDDSGAYVQTVPDKDFSEHTAINDSLVLLSEFYDYHPADGPAGLQLHIYNTKRRQFVVSKTYRLPGIMLGNMAIFWTTANKDNIYAFAGLSGRVFKYDLNLEPVSENAIIGLLDENTLTANLKYEHETDSFIYGEHDEVAAALKILRMDTANKNTSVTSEIYRKDFIWNSIKEVRDNRTFLERVIKLNDSEVFLCIYSSAYRNRYMDVMRYNLRSGKIIQKMLKVQSAVGDSLKAVEDYFSVDLINGALTAPYFYKNNIYVINLFDPELYQGENRADFDEKLFNYAKENGYKWQISKYVQKD